jgi:hypothetical protein
LPPQCHRLTLTDSLIRNAKAGLNPLQKAESKKQASGVRGGRPSASVIDNEIPPKKKPYPATRKSHRARAAEIMESSSPLASLELFTFLLF